jgi:hypothetical protein
MIHRVKDLWPAKKRVVEFLLGHSFSEDEFLSIKRLPPGAIISLKTLA